MTEAPNIIYILADDMGYGDISALNADSRIHTPCLDQLAAEGIFFTDAHSSSAVCTPSRYSILTGRYNWRSKLKSGVLWGFSPPLIEQGRRTVASILQEQGYRTACIGKWHLGLDWTRIGDQPEEVDYSKPFRQGPTAYGFDYFYGISASLDMPPYVYIENEHVTELPNRTTGNADGKQFWREGPTAPSFRHEEVLSHLTGKTLDTIEQWKDEPFFIYFPLPAPHTPILPEAKFRGKSGTNEYGDFVLMCDHLVGKIMRKLEEHQLSDNTIVLFASDNGCSPMADFPQLLDKGHNPSYCFRGHKADIYEGGHRIPLIVKWPAAIAAGRSSDEPVCLSDLMATIADVVQVELPRDAGEDSISNYPLWTGHPYHKPLREAIVHHSIDGSFSIRQGRWKLVLCPGSGGWSYPRPGEAASDAPPYQLYDLEADIGEQKNALLQHPEVVEQLKQLLERYIQDGHSRNPVLRQ